MGNKKTIYAILIVAMLVSGLIFLLNKSDNKNIVSTNQGSSTVRSTSGDNVVTKDGKQILAGTRITFNHPLAFLLCGY